MASKTFSLRITGNDDFQPFESGAPDRSLHGLINYLKSLVGGCRNGNVTLACKNDLVYATGTVTCAAVANADTVTVNGTALTATQHNSRGTATFTTIVADNVVTLNGVAFTAKVTAVGEQQFALGADDTAAAANLAAKVNACTHASISGVVTATSALGVVTFRAVSAGAGGDAILLARTGAPIAVSGANLTGGAAVANNQFDFGGSNTQTGAALAAAIAASSTALVSGGVSAANADGVVTLTALHGGVAGNSITLASSNGTRLAVSGARLTGGTETAISFSF